MLDKRRVIRATAQISHADPPAPRRDHLIIGKSIAVAAPRKGFPLVLFPFVVDGPALRARNLHGDFADGTV